MRTPDGISRADWDPIQELAVSLFNAIGTDEEAVRKSKLFDLLDRLEEKYGALPSILATRADFTDDRGQRGRILQRAYNLAKERKDSRNILYIAHSLAELNIEELANFVEGRKWLECMKETLVEADDSWFADEYQRLRDRIILS